MPAESERPLAAAKRAVEPAIETNEQTALDMLTNKPEKTNATAKLKHST